MKKKFLIMLLLISLIITYNYFISEEQKLDSANSGRDSTTETKELSISKNLDRQNLKDNIPVNSTTVKKQEQKLEKTTNILKIKQESNASEKLKLNIKEEQLTTSNDLTNIKQAGKNEKEKSKNNLDKSNKLLEETLIKENEQSISNKPRLLSQIKDHRVKKGETLWEIARKHDIDIDTLIGANDINDMNKIKPGQVVKILPVKGILYKIGPGENLSSIASNFNISLNKIISSNHITDPDRVEPGKMLILPGVKPEFGYQDRLERLFIKPIDVRISSYFGNRWGRMHEGLDFAAPSGTEVRAAGKGRVVYSGWASGYGKTIIIEHQKGMRTLYGHNSKLLVRSGEWVSRGELISKSGNTGRTTGPNMHFEVQVNGRPVNPLTYLR